MRCLAFAVLVVHVFNWPFANAEEVCAKDVTPDESDVTAAVQVRHRHVEGGGPKGRRGQRGRRINQMKNRKRRPRKGYYYDKPAPAPAPGPAPGTGCGKGCCTWNRVSFFAACENGAPDPAPEFPQPAPSPAPTPTLAQARAQIRAKSAQTQTPICTGDSNPAVSFGVSSVAVTEDLMTLVYTDSTANTVGFVDITDAYNPVALSVVTAPAEGTAPDPITQTIPLDVATKGSRALVVAKQDGGQDGYLLVYHASDPSSPSLESTELLGGEPDSIAVSPDGKFALVTIVTATNGDPGFLLQFDITSDSPTMWSSETIPLTDLNNIDEAENPRPTQVSIRADNVAVVTLQANNGIVLVDMKLPLVDRIIASYTAGMESLTNVDLEANNKITLDDSTQEALPREPDGVVWLGKKSPFYATADEGVPASGGTRSFTIFNESGEVAFTSGNLLDQLSARLGHYPDALSEERGSEPENVDYGVFRNCEMLFVQTEGSSLSFVFEVSDPANPSYLQALPAIKSPQRGITIPRRSLYVTASDGSDIPNDIRSGINIYECQYEEYPTLESNDTEDGLPIPWGSIAGLTGEMETNGQLWAVEGKFFAHPQILRIVTDAPLREGECAGEWPGPPLIVENISITNDQGEFAEGLDLVGIDLIPAGNILTDGGFMLADRGEPAATPDPAVPGRILFVDANGVIQNEAFEVPCDPGTLSGVAFSGLQPPAPGYVVTCTSGEVYFCTFDGAATSCQQGTPYSLDPATLPAVVELRDVAVLDENTLLLLETDNQAGFDAAVRRIYKVEFTLPDTQGDPPTLGDKELVEDFLLELKDLRGPILPMFNSLAVTGDLEDEENHKLTLWVVNDNEGTDGTNGETQLLPFVQHFYGDMQDMTDGTGTDEMGTDGGDR